MHKIFCAVAILDRTEPMMEASFAQACATSQSSRVLAYRQIGDSYIMRVRNYAVTEFLINRQDCDYYAQWSGDIEVLNRSATDNVWDRLVALDKPFVGAIYCCSSPTRKLSSELSTDETIDKPVVKVRYLSGGLWLVHRDAVAKMAEAYPELQYNGDGPFAGGKMYGLFNGTTTEDGDFLTEDFWFCKRWREMGGKIYADTGIKIRHWGKAGFEL